MTLDKITISNFKSIDKLEFDVKKYGNSYTTMLLGLNEAGKSNILEAMSFFDVPEKEYDFNILHNQKNEDSGYIDLYFYLSFESKQSYLDLIKKNVINGKELNFTLTNISKNVYLPKGEKAFIYAYSYKIVGITPNLFIKKTADNKIEISKENDASNTFVELTDENVVEFLGSEIENSIMKYEPKVSFWKPEDKYLISSSINLNEFKDSVFSNLPLKNIFSIAGYETSTKIKSKIDEISNPQKRSKLASVLSEKTTEYIKSIWKHKIDFIIDISETGNCTISIKDEGKNNIHDRHSMNVRSEGFKQFISLILSLSIETDKLKRTGRLILIDEPENHLHPSGIRDLGKELLKIGETNYLFISTHSPFLIDHKQQERHIIIKKDINANTVKKEIKEHNDLRDDEVLSEAFGISIYKDLINLKRILVEGASDKLILKKSCKLLGLDYGITNGTGSNIVQVASKLNDDDIGMLVLVDDDSDGKKYKKDILKIDGVYNSSNVFTLRDLVSEAIDNGTIEDLLGKEYVQGQFKALYNEIFKEETAIELNENSCFIEQIKIALLKEQKENKIVSNFIDKLKVDISENFNPSKTTFKTKFPLIKALIEKIKDILSKE